MKSKKALLLLGLSLVLTACGEKGEKGDPEVGVGNALGDKIKLGPFRSQIEGVCLALNRKKFHFNNDNVVGKLFKLDYTERECNDAGVNSADPQTVLAHEGGHNYRFVYSSNGPYFQPVETDERGYLKEICSKTFPNFTLDWNEFYPTPNEAYQVRFKASDDGRTTIVNLLYANRDGNGYKIHKEIDMTIDVRDESATDGYVLNRTETEKCPEGSVNNQSLVNYVYKGRTP